MEITRELTHHLERLVVEIGERQAGSPAAHAAGAYIQQVFQDAGLEVEEQRYDCPAWRPGETWLAIDGRRLEAAANTFSPACDVSGPTVAACTLAELEAAEMTGRIGILYGDLTKATLAAKDWFLKSERDTRIVEVVEAKEPAALVTVQARPGSRERLIEDGALDIPSVTVDAQTGLALLQADAPRVHVHVESERAPGWSANVVGRRGSANGPKVVLCAHYDTKVGTPGATDNAAGTATLLALTQVLARRALTLGLECVAFSGHESLPLGDDEYVRRGEDQFPQIVAAINFDAVGDALGANSIAAFASGSRFPEAVAELTVRYPGTVWVKPWPESNHSTFAWRGVPSLALSRSVGGNITHQCIDTIERVSVEKLAQAVALTVEIVASLQERSPAWTRPTE